ncbi:hypothetical protein P7C73_g6094, partial [Tremellales sp. Uapishka_1]
MSAPEPPAKPKVTPSAEPVKGSFSVLEHTGIPKSVLNWKPKLPSRNWSIFLTIVGSISYLYYDDRRQCRQIREAYLEKVRYLSEEPTNGSLDVPRKVTVYGAKWPEDDDADRALRYFRKYVKPYLVAAAIDYEQVPAPLHGSITRQVHAAILKRRRQALGLEPSSPMLALPGVLDARAQAQRELEGGTILIGRPSLKEYLEGLRRGWSGGVNEWDWEKDVEAKIKGDGVFEPQQEPELGLGEPLAGESAPSASISQPSSVTGLSFLSRPPPSSFSSSSSSSPQIPSHLHT